MHVYEGLRPLHTASGCEQSPRLFGPSEFPPGQHDWPSFPQPHTPAEQVPNPPLGIRQASPAATQAPRKQQPPPAHVLPGQHDCPGPPQTKQTSFSPSDPQAESEEHAGEVGQQRWPGVPQSPQSGPVHSQR